MSLTWKQMMPIKIPCSTKGFVKDTSYTLEITDDDMLVITESKTGAVLTMDHEAAKRFVFIDGDQIDCTHRRSPAITFRLSQSRKAQFQLDICKLILWLEYRDTPEERLTETLDQIVAERVCRFAEDGFKLTLFYIGLIMSMIYSLIVVDGHWYIALYLCSTIVVGVLTFWLRISTEDRMASWIVKPCIVLYSCFCLLFLPLFFVSSYPMTFLASLPFLLSLDFVVEYVMVLRTRQMMQKLVSQTCFAGTAAQGATANTRIH